MLHSTRVLTSLYWSSRTSLRTSLGIKKRKVVPSVLSEGTDRACQRYLDICRFYQAHIDAARDVSGHVVSEVGCGNCLASGDMLLGMGASHVDLIESQPIVIDAVQKEVLEKCSRTPGMASRNEILNAQGELDPAKATAIPQFLEHLKGGGEYRLMLSYDVLEHVEDLETFFISSFRLLQPGGVMLHKIDLSGHEFFEDPLPPLDFQTYPNWLYAWISPKYRRATRRLQEEYLDSIQRAGFVVEEIGILREADDAYVERLRPNLRRQIRNKLFEQLKALDWYVKARKPFDSPPAK